jgi:hypothetical protein
MVGVAVAVVGGAAEATAGWEAAPACESARALTGRAVSAETHSAALQHAQARK